MTNRELFEMSELQRQNIVFLIYTVSFIIIGFIFMGIGILTEDKIYNYVGFGWSVVSIITSSISRSKQAKVIKFKEELETEDNKIKL